MEYVVASAEANGFEIRLIDKFHRRDHVVKRGALCAHHQGFEVQIYEHIDDDDFVQSGFRVAVDLASLIENKETLYYDLSRGRGLWVGYHNEMVRFDAQTVEYIQFDEQQIAENVRRGVTQTEAPSMDSEVELCVAASLIERIGNFDCTDDEEDARNMEAVIASMPAAVA